MQRDTEHYFDFYNSEKVIVAVYDFDYEQLRFGGGSNFDHNKQFCSDTLYDFQADDTEIYSQTFRFDKGIRKLIPEKLFEEGFRKFTDIRDIDGFFKESI